MLKIDLLREAPEALKPRQIPINAVNDNEKLEHKQTG
jgi:molecular chaperone IbpA